MFAVVYERSRFIDFLERRLGKQPDVFEERPGGQSSVFTLSIDENGRPLAETLMISMAAWAFGIVETRGLDALPHGDACDTDGLHTPPGKSEMPPSDSGFPGFDIQLDRLPCPPECPHAAAAWPSQHWCRTTMAGRPLCSREHRSLSGSSPARHQGSTRHGYGRSGRQRAALGRAQSVGAKP